ncbi:MAG: histidinol phosphate phosphatase [Oscillibacter sp.]|nr:histidinol phosphate phosphatase [Oscillibacter sp.]
MTVYDCSVHTHADLCDGKEPLSAMAAGAFAAGVKHYGVSCHSHTPLPLDEGGVLPADMRAYKAAILRERERYAGRMEVLMGLEWDSQSDVSPEGFDYWIASAHYQKAPNGECYCADWGEDHFHRCREEAWGGDPLAVTEGYYREVARIAALKPTILGHFDLITKHNGPGLLFDESHPRYIAAALEALHAADPKATLLEINTGGVARGYRTAPYPALFLLREWKAMGGRIIVTSDAHNADKMLYGYGMAVELARAAGFAKASILTMDGEKECGL